jgi:hypothetical protein
MEIETIEKILNFLEEKEGKKITKSVLYSIKKLKLIKELENHPDGSQYRYEGDLYLINSIIRKLPNDLYVTGNCYLEDSYQLKVLPIKLHVGGSLDLANCVYITELPDNLYVGGDLGIYYTPIAQKYSSQEIREMITSKGGTLIGKIYR